MFIGNPHFFLNLVQTLRNSMSLSFVGGLLLTAHKDKFVSNESPTQTFWLASNVTSAQKRVPNPQPWSRDSKTISP